MKYRYVVLSLALLLVLTACSAAGGAPGTSVVPLPPTETLLPTQVPLSFAAASYRNTEVGFELDHPAVWTASDLTVLGDRGSTIQFTAADGTVTSLTIYRWDPTGDLAAYVAHRKDAWSASGMVLLSEQAMTLAGDRPGVRFVIQSAEGQQVFFFFTPFGDRYLELAGPGDPALLAEVAATIRPVSGTP